MKTPNKDEVKNIIAKVYKAVEAFITKTNARKLKAKLVGIVILFIFCMFVGAYMVESSHVMEARSYGSVQRSTWKTFPCAIMTFLSCFGCVFYFMITLMTFADTKD